MTITLAALRDRIPDYAKDLRLNLDSVLTEAGAPGLSQKQIWLVACASALACGQRELRDAIADSGKLGAAEVDSVAAVFAVMAMNNVYYRFAHLVGDPAYRELPARLRMNGLSRPGLTKIDVEICALAVSAINGCGQCMDAHERVLRQGGLGHEAVQSAVRIAAVLQGVASVLRVSPEVRLFA